MLNIKYIAKSKSDIRMVFISQHSSSLETNINLEYCKRVCMTSSVAHEHKNPFAFYNMLDNDVRHYFFFILFLSYVFLSMFFLLLYILE